jgi:hypothetical protein
MEATENGKPNYKNGDIVYVLFVLEVDYKEYDDGSHYALCREHNSTELVFKDLETAKKIAEKLHNEGHLGEYSIKKGVYNSGSYPCLAMGINELVYMSEYASKINNVIEDDYRKKAEAEAKRIAENVKRFNEYPEIQEIRLSNGDIIKFVKSTKSGQYGSGKYSTLLLKLNGSNDINEFWFDVLFKTNGKLNTRNYHYHSLLSTIPKAELDKILHEYRDKYNQISGLKLA